MGQARRRGLREFLNTHKKGSPQRAAPADGRNSLPPIKRRSPGVEVGAFVVEDSPPPEEAPRPRGRPRKSAGPAEEEALKVKPSGRNHRGTGALSAGPAPMPMTVASPGQDKSSTAFKKWTFA